MSNVGGRVEPQAGSIGTDRPSRPAKLSTRLPTNKVTRPEADGLSGWIEGIRDEALERTLRVTSVPAGNAMSGDQQFASNSDRNGIEMFIDHIADRIRDRPPNRCCRRIREHLRAGRPNRGLGWPIEIHTSPTRSRSSSARARCSRSPPTSAFRVERPFQPPSIIICQVAGVPCIMLMLLLESCAASRPPSRTASSSAITTRAPTVSGSRSSKTAISKATVVTASRLSSDDMGNSNAIAARKLDKALRRTSTPIGPPVDPEV